MKYGMNNNIFPFRQYFHSCYIVTSLFTLHRMMETPFILGFHNFCSKRLQSSLFFFFFLFSFFMEGFHRS